MTSNVQKIVEQVKSLPRKELDELLSWLAQYELEQTDSWDEELERDSQPGGRLDSIIQRVRSDVSSGKEK